MRIFCFILDFIFYIPLCHKVMSFFSFCTKLTNLQIIIHVTSKRLLQVRVPPHSSSHFPPPVPPVPQQQIQDMVSSVQRIQAGVAVQELIEVDHTAALAGRGVDYFHYLEFDNKNVKYFKNCLLNDSCNLIIQSTSNYHRFHHYFFSHSIK